MSLTPQILAGFPDPGARERRSSFASANHPGEDVAPPALEAALVDLERALCRDRSHALVVVPPGPGGPLLLPALRERLAGSLPVVHVTDPTVHEDAICARILSGLRRERSPDSEARLLSLVHELARGDSALVLLVGDAGSMPAQTLGRLGRLATASRSGLRLVLAVAIDAGSGDDAIAEVVRALGIGVQKVVLHTRVGRAEAGAFAPALPERGITPLATARASAAPGPDASAEKRGQRSRSRMATIRIAKPRGYPAHAARWPLAATAALGIALALLGGQLPSASLAPREAAPAPARVAERIEPARSGVPAAPPVRSIPVSLNAWPWARIEVDGRGVGITPLADLPMAPGPHRFRAYLADGRVIDRTLRIDAQSDHISFP
jgi:hypothetical protein